MQARASVRDLPNESLEESRVMKTKRLSLLVTTLFSLSITLVAVAVGLGSSGTSKATAPRFTVYPGENTVAVAPSKPAVAGLTPSYSPKSTRIVVHTPIPDMGSQIDLVQEDDVSSDMAERSANANAEAKSFTAGQQLIIPPFITSTPINEKTGKRSAVNRWTFRDVRNVGTT